MHKMSSILVFSTQFFKKLTSNRLLRSELISGTAFSRGEEDSEDTTPSESPGTLVLSPEGSGGGGGGLLLICGSGGGGGITVGRGGAWVTVGGVGGGGGGGADFWVTVGGGGACRIGLGVNLISAKSSARREFEFLAFLERVSGWVAQRYDPR